MIATLKRQEVRAPRTLTMPSGELLEQARLKLGYNPEPDVDARNGDALRLALRQLNIKPFTPSSVEKYKARMRRKVSGRTFLVRLFVAVVALAVASAAAVIITNAYALFAVIPVIGAGTAFIIGINDFEFYRAGWVRRSFSKDNDRRDPISREYLPQYTEPIPAFALETATRIKSVVPGAEVYVMELRVETPQQRVERLAAARDPFLVVSYGDCTAYVEVWDEPTFDATREA